MTGLEGTRRGRGPPEAPRPSQGWPSQCPCLWAELELPPVLLSLKSPRGLWVPRILVCFRTCRFIFNFCFCLNSGINYDKPLPPIQVASLRAERIAKEKKVWQPGRGLLRGWGLRGCRPLGGACGGGRVLPAGGCPTHTLLPCRLWRISRRLSSRQWHSPRRPLRSRRPPSSPLRRCPSPLRRAASSRPRPPCHHLPRHSPQRSPRSPHRRRLPQSPRWAAPLCW